MKGFYRLGLAALVSFAIAVCVFSPMRIVGGSGTENTNGTLISVWTCDPNGLAAKDAAIWIGPHRSQIKTIDDYRDI